MSVCLTRPATALLAVTALLLVGCGGGDAGRLPDAAGPTRAMHEHFDGFDFMPPLHQSKSLTTFNAEAKPVVEIYAGTEANRGPLLRRFETAEITVGTDLFQVNWNTKDNPGGLGGNSACVIEVYWETAGARDQMGYVDCLVDAVAGKGKKTADADYSFDLKDGRTLPIKFVIDRSVPEPVDIAVTAITSNSAVQGETVDLTVTGAGFRPGATVSLGEGVTVHTTTVAGDYPATQAAVNASIAAEAAVGPRNVTITNPSGHTATLVDGFSVQAPVVTPTERWVTVILTDSQGSGLAGGEVYYYQSGWQALDITDENGIAAGEVPKSPADIELRYAGGKYKWTNVNTTANPTLELSTVAVTVELRDSSGAPLLGEALYYWSGWKSLGQTPATVELLPYSGLSGSMQGGYDFQTKFGARTSATLRQDVAVSTVVTLVTTLITATESPAYYYNDGGWRLFASPMEVMGGDGKFVDFKFGGTGGGYPTYRFFFSGFGGELTVSPSPDHALAP